MKETNMVMFDGTISERERFEEWMGKNYEEPEWDEGWSREDMFDAWQASKGWYKTPDDMPEQFQRVFMCMTYPVTHHDAGVYWGNNVWYSGGLKLDTSQVTHWQPIPRSPWADYYDRQAEAIEERR